MSEKLTKNDWVDLIKDYDASGDGNISDAEIRVLLEDYEKKTIKNQRTMEILKLFDVDGDGKISVEELAIFRQVYMRKPSEKQLAAEKQEQANKYDDGTSQLTSDEYVKYRIYPILANFQEKTPGLSFTNNCIITFVIVLSVCSSVFSSFGLITFIPAALAFVHAITSWQSYKQIDTRLGQTNAAVQQLNKLLIWWDSLNMIQKRDISNKSRLVETTENIIAARFMNTSVSKADTKEDKDDELD